MSIQSNSIVIVFFVLAGILLVGLIIFLVVYFSRSTNEAEPKEYIKSVAGVEKNENQPAVVREFMHDPSYSRLVTFGRAVSNDSFAVQFGEEWINDSQSLSFVQRNRLEKNLEEAKRWLGTADIIETPKVPVTNVKIASEIVPPLVPQIIVEKHKRQMSIVEQVDEILQELLEKDVLESQNIRLTELPNKGVIVWVGNEYYEGINAVPDDNVKRIIRQAVKKWEETPGT